MTSAPCSGKISAAGAFLSCAEVIHADDGRSLQTAGFVIFRQMPRPAKGVMFITLEDETGVANLVIWHHPFGRHDGGPWPHSARGLGRPSRRPSVDRSLRRTGWRWQPAICIPVAAWTRRSHSSWHSEPPDSRELPSRRAGCRGTADLIAPVREPNGQTTARDGPIKKAGKLQLMRTLRKRSAFGQNGGGSITARRSAASSQRRHASPWRQ